MGLGGCYGLLKCIVVVINSLFFIAGVTITSICTWVLIEPTYPVVQDANNYIYGFIVLLVVGILLTLVGTLGWCGACKESQCLLVTFFSLLLVVVVAQIASVVWAFMNVDQLREMFRTNMEKTVSEDYGNMTTDTQAFDIIQKELHCCGAHGPMDWATSRYGGEGRKEVVLRAGQPEQKYNIPPSCCQVPEDDVLCVAALNPAVGAQVSQHIFSDGCMMKLYEYVDGYRPLFLGLFITAGILELLGLVLSIILCCAVRFVDRYKA